MNFQDFLKTNVIVEHLAGSNISSDTSTNYRGIFWAPKLSIISPWETVEQITDVKKEDAVYHELRKFMKLLVDQNPNIVETLWVDESCITFQSDVYKKLRKQRKKLLSSRVAFTYSGYAMSQLKRIKGHNKWINNPAPSERPRQDAYLSLVFSYGTKAFKFQLDEFQEDHRLIHYGNQIYGIYRANGKTIANVETGILNTEYDQKVSSDQSIDPYGEALMTVKFNRDVYDQDVEKWRQYHQWKKNRNDTRSHLEMMHGYDTKHAMHLVRLMRMAEEILTEGNVHVLRPDAEELLEIRNGAWCYDDLIQWAEDKNTKIRNVCYPKTSLQKHVDYHWAGMLLLELYEECWSQS